jgi:hypothetical protein
MTPQANAHHWTTKDTERVAKLVKHFEDAEYYLEEARYLIQGEKQLGVQATAGVRENLNRAASKLQAIREFYPLRYQHEVNP